MSESAARVNRSKFAQKTILMRNRFRSIAFQTFIALIIAAGLTACKKDNDAAFSKSESPLQEWVTSNTFTNIKLSEGPYSLGYQFIVWRDGKITGLGLSSPITGDFNVRLYNVTDQTMLAEMTVTVKPTDTTSVKSFVYAKLPTPVVVTSSKEYVVAYSTVNSSDSFYRFDKGTQFSLPFLSTNTNISVESGVYGDANAYPDVSWPNVYTADIQFTAN